VNGLEKGSLLCGWEIKKYHPSKNNTNCVDKQIYNCINNPKVRDHQHTECDEDCVCSISIYSPCNRSKPQFTFQKCRGSLIMRSCPKEKGWNEEVYELMDKYYKHKWNATYIWEHKMGPQQYDEVKGSIGR